MRSHRDRVTRARRAWDVGASAHDSGGRIEALQKRELWSSAVRSLQLRPGDVVLDVGCGAGNAFPALREAVGDSGRIVGIDVSPKMLTRAQARIDANGWTNVEVRLTDASTSTDLEPDTYDAAIASFSLSTVPDLNAAAERVHAALRPGGKLYFADAHFRPGLPRALRLLYRVLTGANGNDVPAAARTRFATVEPVIAENGDLAPHGERSWPPVAAGLATKTTTTQAT